MKTYANQQSKLLFYTGILLILLGSLAIYASSALKGFSLFHDSFYFFKKHLFVGAFSFLLALFLQAIPKVWLDRLPLPMIFISITLLMCFFIPQVYQKVGGAYRWMKIGPIRFQPADFAKIGVLFFLAKNLSRETVSLDNFSNGLKSTLFVIGLVCGLLLLQPDFGNCVLLASITFLLLYVRGLSRSFIFLLGGFGCIAFLSLIAYKPYRLRRFFAFLDPWSNSQDSGFQIIQSYLAIYNGGWFGSGLGESKQKLFYLPEVHTDFILALIGEELGSIGIITVAGLLFFMVKLGFEISSKVKDTYLKLLSFAIASLIGLQSFFNIGVVLGLLPTKGISLPFLSSGSSSLFSFIFLSGVLARIGREVESH